MSDSVNTKVIMARIDTTVYGQYTGDLTTIEIYKAKREVMQQEYIDLCRRGKAASEEAERAMQQADQAEYAVEVLTDSKQHFLATHPQIAELDRRIEQGAFTKDQYDAYIAIQGWIDMYSGHVRNMEEQRKDYVGKGPQLYQNLIVHLDNSIRVTTDMTKSKEKEAMAYMQAHPAIADFQNWLAQSIPSSPDQPQKQYDTHEYAGAWDDLMADLAAENAAYSGRKDTSDDYNY